MRNFGFFFLSFYSSQAVMKMSSMTPFFVQKEVLGEKIVMQVKYGNFFTQILMFSIEKVDDLREREREEKGTTNSTP